MVRLRVTLCGLRVLPILCLSSPLWASPRFPIHVCIFCHRFVSLCVCGGCIHESVGVHTCLHVQKPEQDVLGVLCLSLPFPLRQSLTEVGAHHFQLGWGWLQVCLQPCMPSCFCGCWASALGSSHSAKHSYSLSALPSPGVSSFDDKFKFYCKCPSG